MASNEFWQVWDDGFDIFIAQRLMSIHERDHPDYEFRVEPSQFHGAGRFQVEGRKKA